jgi:hypothetical protein
LLEGDYISRKDRKIKQGSGAFSFIEFTSKLEKKSEIGCPEQKREKKGAYALAYI